MLRSNNIAVFILMSACSASSTVHRHDVAPTTKGLPAAAAHAQALQLLQAEDLQARPRALSLLLHACQRDHVQSCAALLDMPDYQPSGRRSAELVIREHCKRGDLWSCNYGRLLSNELLDRGMTEQACREGTSYACTWLARQNGNSELFARSCLQADAEACSALESKDPSWSVLRKEAHARQCTAGVLESCVGTERSERDAAITLKDCLDGIGLACRQGIGDYDGEVELRVRKTACAVHPVSCLELAALFRERSDAQGEREALARGCLTHVRTDDGTEFKMAERRTACVEGAKLLGNDARAAKMRAVACKIGDAASCSPR